jgi:hypothetical protein
VPSSAAPSSLPQAATNRRAIRSLIKNGCTNANSARSNFEVLDQRRLFGQQIDLQIEMVPVTWQSGECRLSSSARVELIQELSDASGGRRVAGTPSDLLDMVVLLVSSPHPSIIR